MGCALPFLTLQVSGWKGASGLHAAGDGNAVAYRGMMDCFVRTVREEGFAALFKVRGAGCIQVGQEAWPIPLTKQGHGLQMH